MAMQSNLVHEKTSKSPKWGGTNGALQLAGILRQEMAFASNITVKELCDSFP